MWRIVVVAALLAALIIVPIQLEVFAEERPEHRVGLIQSGATPNVAQTWSYDDMWVTWGSNPILGPDDQFHVMQLFDGMELTCIRFGAVSLDPHINYSRILGGWLISHGSTHEVCFENLRRTVWRGPPADREDF